MLVANMRMELALMAECSVALMARNHWPVERSYLVLMLKLVLAGLQGM